MVSKITLGIKISVNTIFDTKNSSPLDHHHVFRYNVEIENLSDLYVKLESRKWLIYDLGYGFTEVAGEGVIGLTPEFLPGEKFTYFSNVILQSGVGNMCGSYLFKNLKDDTFFEVEIPKFHLYSTVLIN